MIHWIVFSSLALFSILGCGKGFQVAEPSGGIGGASTPQPQLLGDRPYNPESMLEKACREPYSWEGAKGESSSLQIIQKPDTNFDYAADYKSLFKELAGQDLIASLDELTRPLVLIPHLTLYESSSLSGGLPSGEVYLKFGVSLADLIASFTDVWLGTVRVEEVVFQLDLQDFKGHICAESLALKFKQAAPGTAQLIVISEKSDAEHGLLVRLWLQTPASAWRYIGFTWIDRRAFIGPASVPLSEKERGPASQADAGGPSWVSWLVLATVVLVAVALSLRSEGFLDPRDD